MGLEGGSVTEVTEVTDGNQNSGEKMIKKVERMRKPGSSSRRINKHIMGK